MSTEYSPFARPKFTAEDFAREDPATTFDSAPRVAPEERTFASEERTFASEDVPRAAYVDPALDRRDETAEDASAFAATPLYAQRAKSAPKTSGRSIAPIAMIAIPAVALLAGVAYFTMQPRDGLIAEQPATVAVAPAAPAPLPEATELAAATPTPAPVEATPAPTAPVAKAATPRVTARAAAPTRVARARPAAAAPGAEDVSGWSRDASATLPTGPIPYSATAQTPSASPAPIIVPPIAAEPVAPAPTPSETPAPQVPDPTIPPTL